MFARAVLVARCKICLEGLSGGVRVGTLAHLSWNPAPVLCFVSASGQAGPGWAGPPGGVAPRPAVQDESLGVQSSWWGSGRCTAGLCWPCADSRHQWMVKIMKPEKM